MLTLHLQLLMINSTFKAVIVFWIENFMKFWTDFTCLIRVLSFNGFWFRDNFGICCSLFRGFSFTRFYILELKIWKLLTDWFNCLLILGWKLDQFYIRCTYIFNRLKSNPFLEIQPNFLLIFFLTFFLTTVRGCSALWGSKRTFFSLSVISRFSPSVFARFRFFFFLGPKTENILIHHGQVDGVSGPDRMNPGSLVSWTYLWSSIYRNIFFQDQHFCQTSWYFLLPYVFSPWSVS